MLILAAVRSSSALVSLGEAVAKFQVGSTHFEVLFRDAICGTIFFVRSFRTSFGGHFWTLSKPVPSIIVCEICLFMCRICFVVAGENAALGWVRNNHTACAPTLPVSFYCQIHYSGSSIQ